jgi:hypothetical protein
MPLRLVGGIAPAWECVAYTALQDAEQVVKRPVKPNFLSTEDWRRRLSQKNSLITKIKAEPKIFIIGSENDLTA